MDTIIVFDRTHTNNVALRPIISLSLTLSHTPALSLSVVACVRVSWRDEERKRARDGKVSKLQSLTQKVTAGLRHGAVRRLASLFDLARQQEGISPGDHYYPWKYRFMRQ